MLSVDVKVPLLRAKELAGSKVSLIGNVDPINTMMLGTPEEVHTEVMRDITDCADSPNGYLISTGCDIPIDAPIENIYAFMDAVREYGLTRLGEKK